MNKLLSVAGILLVVAAVVYCVVPANSLAPWLPGYEPGLSRIHYMHGGGSLGAGLGLLAYAWFRTRRK